MNNIKVVKSKNDFTGKYICKHCGNIIFKELEQYQLYKNKDDETDKKELFAFFIEPIKTCPKCKHKNFAISIISGKLITTIQDNIVTFNKKTKSLKKDIIYKVYI